MATKTIEDMTVEELVALCHGKICEEVGCYRKTAPGYVLCLNCLHGTSERADESYVAAKKQLVKLARKMSKS